MLYSEARYPVLLDLLYSSVLDSRNTLIGLSAKGIPVTRQERVYLIHERIIKLNAEGRLCRLRRPGEISGKH